MMVAGWSVLFIAWPYLVDQVSPPHRLLAERTWYGLRFAVPAGVGLFPWRSCRAIAAGPWRSDKCVWYGALLAAMRPAVLAPWTAHLAVSVTIGPATTLSDLSADA